MQILSENNIICKLNVNKMDILCETPQNYALSCLTTSRLGKRLFMAKKYIIWILEGKNLNKKDYIKSFLGICLN